MLYSGAFIPGWMTALSGRVHGEPRYFANSFEIIVAMTLTPVVIAVAEAAGSHGHENDLPARLWPGLAILAALLLVLPEPDIKRSAGWLGLVAASVMTGLGAINVVSRSTLPIAEEAYDRLCFALLGALIGAVLQSAVEWLFSADPSVIRSLPWTWAAFRAGWHGLWITASWYALVRLGARRWSALYAAVPLLLLAYVWLGMQAIVGWRWYAALLLLVCAALRLTLDDEEGKPMFLSGL